MLKSTPVVRDPINDSMVPKTTNEPTTARSRNHLPCTLAYTTKKHSGCFFYTRPAIPRDDHYIRVHQTSEWFSYYTAAPLFGKHTQDVSGTPAHSHRRYAGNHIS